MSLVREAALRARDADRRTTTAFYHRCPEARCNFHGNWPHDYATPARPYGLPRLLCRLRLHQWVTMTTARQGYVSFDRCQRGCGASRVRKGSA